MIPKRRKRPKMGLRVSTVIRCPGHLKFVRGHECCIAGIAGRGYIRDLPSDRPDVIAYRVSVVHECEGRIEAHHVREGDHGQGMGQKPDDSTAVPLCSQAHKRLHDMGSITFEREWRVDLNKIAEQLWKISPHRIAYERKSSPPSEGR